MSLATVAQINLFISPQKITDAGIANGDIQAMIGAAETEVRSAMGNMVDFTFVPAISAKPPTQPIINNMVVYKTMELLLVRIHGASRNVDTISDVEYWRKKYEVLRDEVLAGRADLSLPNGFTAQSSASTYKNTDTIPPSFGDTKWGDFINPQSPNQDFDTTL